MFRMLCRVLCGLLLLGNIALTQAATLPPGLNTATVPITSQSPADLHAALVNAFSQVLVKISGNSRITSLPGIQQQLATADRFAQKYRYVDGNLQVAFDPRALITLLAQAQQPVWLSIRPVTLVWLSVGGQAPLTAAAAAPNTPNPVVAMLQGDADARAIPIAFPTMTADDQADWNAKTSGTAFNQPILEKIAQRYQQPAILYGEMAQAADQSWSTNWFLVWRGQTWQWRNDGTQAVVLQAGIDKVADLMGSQLAVNLNQEDANNFWLAILGVNNLADYSAMLDALKLCQPVLGVMVQDVGSHGVLLQVTTIGDNADSLTSALAANPHFTPLQTTDTQALHYQWKP